MIVLVSFIGLTLIPCIALLTLEAVPEQYGRYTSRKPYVTSERALTACDRLWRPFSLHGTLNIEVRRLSFPSSLHSKTLLFEDFSLTFSQANISPTPHAIPSDRAPLNGGRLSCGLSGPARMPLWRCLQP